MRVLAVEQGSHSAAGPRPMALGGDSDAALQPLRQVVGSGYALLNEKSAGINPFRHLLNRGHTGKVLCVGASQSVEYIVSGGEDYTTRVWKFDDPRHPSRDGSTPTGTFELHAVLVHDEEREEAGRSPDPPVFNNNDNRHGARGVTVVSFVGVHGPVISGTSRGDLVLFDLATGKVETKTGLHTNYINALCSFQQEGASEGLVASACQGGLCRVFKLQGLSDRQTSEKNEPEVGFQTPSLDEWLELKHSSPVLSIRHIDSMSSGGIRFATCVETGVHLWDLQGKLINKIRVPGSLRTRYLASTSGHNACLVFVSDGEQISVWAIETGKLVGSADDVEEPLMTYEKRNFGIDCDQAGSSTDYAIHIDSPYVVQVWGLTAFPSDGLALPPKEWNLFILPGKEQVLMELAHESEVHAMTMVEDPICGPCLVSACDNAVFMWDVEGTDAGEVTGQLRSLKLTEVLVPPLMILVTFLQVSLFAFGPAISWPQKVHKVAQSTQKFVMLDISLSIPKAMILLPEAIAVNCVMVVFLLVELTGFYEAFDTLERDLLSTRAFRVEKREGRFGCRHVLKMLVNRLQQMVWLLMYSCSTFLIAPMSKVCAQFLDCAPNADGESVLVVNPLMQCWSWETGHMQLAITTLVIVPLFIVGLLPYAVVAGDSSYVQRREIVNPSGWISTWPQNAHRCASVVNRGFVHRHPKYIFRTLLLETVSKAAIPYLSVLLTYRPVTQMGLMTALGLLMFVTSVTWKPGTEPTYCAVIQGLRLFTLGMMLCGCLVVWLNDRNRVEPTVALIFVAVLVPAFTIYRLCVLKMAEKRVMIRTTGGQSAERADELSPE